jgi:hypothetical protein
MDNGTENGILLWRPAHSGKGPNRVFAMIDFLYFEHGEFMLETVIAQVIAEGTFWKLALRIDVAGDTKISLSQNGESIGPGNHLDSMSPKKAGKK